MNRFGTTSHYFNGLFPERFNKQLINDSRLTKKSDIILIFLKTMIKGYCNFENALYMYDELYFKIELVTLYDLA